ncbi:hypothetical protein [Sphingomonas sp.]|uniref:hypothetical protein n=1 Tax=Sphingomonas sp. TaxID=28214 RepID=UPI003B00257C
MTPALQVREAAQRLGRLSPDWRNPERYFEERSEIERDLRQLVKRLEREHG